MTLVREQPIQVIASRAEKQACRAFPEPQGDGLKRGTSRSSQTGAMLIQRVYEIDPLCCPKCQGAMKVIAFIEPPQAAVIEKTLRHCGLWHSSRAPPADRDFVHDARAGTARRRATSRGN